MKLAILSESPADDAAVRILAGGLLSAANAAVEYKSMRHRHGFDSIPDVLPSAIPELHYNRDADALVVVVDSNGTPVHSEAHISEPESEKCRLCRLNRLIADELRRLSPVAGRAPLRYAVGLACPSVEAWFRCGKDPHATETAWARDLASGRSAPEYIRKLKLAVYGTVRPSLPVETECMTKHARRLAQNLAMLEECFPGGFGTMARTIRAWKAE